MCTSKLLTVAAQSTPGVTGDRQKPQFSHVGPRETSTDPSTGAYCVCVFCDVLPTGPESRTNPRLLKKQLMFCTIAMTERRALSTAPDTGVSQCLSSWLPPSDKNEMKEYENL